MDRLRAERHICGNSFVIMLEQLREQWSPETITISQNSWANRQAEIQLRALGIDLWRFLRAIGDLDHLRPARIWGTFSIHTHARKLVFHVTAVGETAHCLPPELLGKHDSWEVHVQKTIVMETDRGNGKQS